MVFSAFLSISRVLYLICFVALSIPPFCKYSKRNGTILTTRRIVPYILACNFPYCRVCKVLYTLCVFRVIKFNFDKKRTTLRVVDSSNLFYRYTSFSLFIAVHRLFLLLSYENACFLVHVNFASKVEHARCAPWLSV